MNKGPRKKLISATSTILFIICILSSGFANAAGVDANQDTYTVISTTTMNEYTMIKDFQNQSDSQLAENGWSAEEITELREFDYEEELELRATKDASILNSMGYTDDQINTLKTFTGSETEQQMMALGASVTITLSAGSQHGHNASSSWAVYSAHWLWSTKPLFNGTDIPAIAWSEGFYLDTTSNQYTYCTINYDLDAPNGTYYGTQYAAVTPNLNLGASANVPMITYVGDVYGTTEWAREGWLGVKLTKQANVPEMAVQAAYGHSTITFAPSVSFGITGGTIGIDFSGSMANTPSNYVYQQL